jgi:gluconolactonase
MDHTRPASRCGVFASMSGFGTPDGMAVDADGNVLCAQMNMGVIWGFGRTGLPIWRIDTCKSPKMSNMAYGGPDNRRLFITDGPGNILAADMPAPGLRLYSHM